MSAAAGYSATPLPQKLGIKAGMRLGLVGAPGGISRTLSPLPEGVQLVSSPRGSCDLILLFCARRKDLTKLARLAPRAGAGGLWICWPKQASGVVTDLSDGAVRAAGLAAGLVDVKVCAVDETWSGLRFLRHKAR